MKEKKMSEPRLSGLNDEQDVGKNKILKSSNHANPDSDNMKQGWEIKKLGEVAEYFNGLTYSPKDVSDNGTIVLRSSNIQNDELDFSDIVRVNVDIKEKLFLKEGDILMCSRNGSQRLVGKTAPIMNLPEPMTFGTFMMIIRSEFSPYLLWFFKTDEFKKQISGGENTMINQVTRYMLDEIKIPLPPLPEQQRIVSILDEAFATIAKAKANAEQNLKNAAALFESYLQGVFDPSTRSGQGKGDGWEEKKLGEVCVTGAGGTPLKAHKDYYEGGKIPWLLSGEVSQGEIFEAKNFITEKGLKNSSAKLFPPNTVLVAMYGATAGQVGILRFEATTNQAVCGILPNKNYLPEFIYYKFLAGKEALVAQAVGGAQPNISQIKIKNTLVPVISIEAQQTIVRQLDALRAETQKLEAVYQKKIADLEELKKSVLQKAFAGELGDGEPAEPKTEKSRRDETIIENKINQTKPNPEGVI